MDELAASRPDTELDEPRDLQIEDTIGAAVIGGSFVTEGGVRVFQRQLFIQVASVGDGTALLEITVTTDSSRAEELNRIVNTFEFTPVLDDESLLPEAADRGS
jgi:hypothetical protein